MNLPPPRAVRRQFWLFVVLAGLTKEEAALAVGLAGRSGYSWFHQAGGVAPSHLHAVVVLRAGRNLRWCRERSVDQCYRQGHWSLALDRPEGTEAKYATRFELCPGPKPGRPRIRFWDYRPSLAPNVPTIWPPDPSRPSWRPSSGCMTRYKPNSTRS